MSMVRLVVRDEKRSLYADQHGGFAASVIAALSDDPDTIEELEHALRRFIAPKPEGYFHFFSEGVDDEPYDAGLVAIDLAARFVACETSYLSAVHRVMLYYHNGEHLTDIAVNYSVSDEWEFRDETLNWKWFADRRRKA